MRKSDQRSGNAKAKWLLVVVLAVLVVFSLVVMAINSTKPGPLDLGNFDAGVQGTAFVRTNQLLVEEMARNWLPNDMFWPTVFLDNMPNFQLGQLELVRYNLRVLRDELTRMRSTDKLDVLAEGAYTALSNDPYKWWFPSAESKWNLAEERLSRFYDSLVAGKSNFYARADNLAILMHEYASLMGGVNTRLVNAPRDVKSVLDLEAVDSGGGMKMVKVDVPWRKIDDNFYYAQGVAYAMLESFKAIRIDFQDILIKKNAMQLVEKIILNLERCNFEPLIVFNGDPGSIFANHSLNLSGVFNDARQKVSSLIVALTQG